MNDEATGGIRSVLHPTDFSEASRLAFAHALRIALSGRTRMDILHADSDSADEPDWDRFPAARQTLADWGVIEQGSSPRVILDQLGVRLAKIGVHGRDAVRAILHFLDRHPSDLIVLATHGRGGLPRWLHGSVAEPVARAAHAMTLFIPHGARGCVAPESGAVTLRRILMPIDRRPAPGRALTAAAQTASLLAGAPVALELLYIGEAGDMPDLPVDQAAWASVERTVRSGDVVGQILAAAAAADLIVMATEGHGGFLDALRGSTTERVLRQAPCPLLAVPAL